MGKAVAAQWWGPKGANYSRGYFYQDDVIAGKPFEKLNPEQQAQLMEEAFKKGVVPPDPLKSLTSQKQTELMEAAIQDGLVPAGTSFKNLTPQQRAQLTPYAVERGFASAQPPFIPNGTNLDITAYVLRAWEMIRAGKGAP